ncbi:MAG: endonuclease Q family protein [Syntrophomonadaceae bacterium]|nr:endonuclease Q family protein [Syntrophomonadaceae bacterium]
MTSNDRVNEEFGYDSKSLDHYFADLHIHIGSAGGKAVKITASRRLDLNTVIFEDAPRKGLDIVGVVDAGSTLVAAEIGEMISAGKLKELEQGGLLASNDVLLVPACEVESREGVHLISYLPNLDAIKQWQKYFRSRVHNLQLSTQRVDAGFLDIMDLSRELGGIFCPAHAFTPHKGIYGMWTDKLVNTIGSQVDRVQALEIGLSADTEMADRLQETGRFTCLSNSDAHSSANVGREYNLLQIRAKNFEEVQWCIEKMDGRRVLANYGLHPRLGKYHRTSCPLCGRISTEEPPVFSCPDCGNSKVIMGVYDRITAIQDYDQAHHPPERPPYYYRIPLQNLPGIGPKLYNALLQNFPNEIEVMEQTPLEDIARIAGKKAAAAIRRMRCGELSITPGGGGKYGKVIINNESE